MFFFLTLCERKDANSPVFSLEIGKFQNITVLVTKAKFVGNNSHFLYFLSISYYEITLTTQEKKLCYIVSLAMVAINLVLFIKINVSSTVHICVACTCFCIKLQTAVSWNPLCPIHALSLYCL